MAIANSNFRVRNGLYVAGNTDLVGNTTTLGNLYTNGTFTANGTGHILKSNTNLGTNSLHINGVNKRVVVNASATSTASDTTDWAFEVVGKTNLSNKVFLGDTLAVNGAATMSNTLSATGAVTFSSTLSVSGNTTLSGNNIHIGSGTTPYTLITGDLKVSGAYISDNDNRYDLDSLNTAIGAIPQIKVYNVAGTQLFP